MRALRTRLARNLKYTRLALMEKNVVIWLTDQDLNRLRQLVADLTRTARGMQAGVETLEEILDLGRVVSPNEIPRNIVTMNSEVVFEDLASREERAITIVYRRTRSRSAEKSPCFASRHALLGLSEARNGTAAAARAHGAHTHTRSRIQPERMASIP